MANDLDPDISDYATKLLKIMKVQLSPPRNEIRDRVFFKDAFTLFLLAARGGYTLDTNLRLTSGTDDFTLPVYDSFRAPFNYIGKKPVHDVFIMYAPPDDPLQAKQMISHYLKNWGEAQKELESSNDDIIRISRFHLAMAKLSISSLESGLHEDIMGNPTNYEPDPTWGFKPLPAEEFPLPPGAVHAARIQGLPLIKIFSNSHKPEYEIKKLMIKKIAQYKNENPQLAEQKKGLLELLERRKNEYEKINSNNSMGLKTLNRELYSMIKAFMALDNAAASAAPPDNSILLGLFGKRDHTQKVTSLINNLYANATKLAEASIKTTNQFNPKEINILIEEFKKQIKPQPRALFTTLTSFIGSETKDPQPSESQNQPKKRGGNK